MSEIWGMILAAGESKRMGRQKLLLPFGDKTIIERVIDNVRDSDIDNTLVVVGSHRDEILDVIGRLDVVICNNENYKEGMLSSVKCGVRSLPASCDGVMVFPGDQPMIPAEAISKVIEAYGQSDKGIVIPVFEKKRGHPLLIGGKYFQEVENLDESIGLRGLAVKFFEDVLEVETGIAEILKDVDTPEEYRELNTEIRRERRSTEIQKSGKRKHRI